MQQFVHLKCFRKNFIQTLKKNVNGAPLLFKRRVAPQSSDHTVDLKPNFFNTNKESFRLLVHGYHEYLYKNAVKILLINIYRYVSIVSAGRTYMYMTRTPTVLHEYTQYRLFPNISDTNSRSKTLRTEIISCLQEYMKKRQLLNDTVM